MTVDQHGRDEDLSKTTRLRAPKEGVAWAAADRGGLHAMLTCSEAGRGRVESLQVGRAGGARGILWREVGGRGRHFSHETLRGSGGVCRRHVCQLRQRRLPGLRHSAPAGVGSGRCTCAPRPSLPSKPSQHSLAWESSLSLMMAGLLRLIEHATGSLHMGSRGPGQPDPFREQICRRRGTPNHMK